MAIRLYMLTYFFLKKEREKEIKKREINKKERKKEREIKRFQPNPLKIFSKRSKRVMIL